MLVASSEMPELLGLCDRVVVLRGGRTVAEFPGGATSMRSRSRRASEDERYEPVGTTRDRRRSSHAGAPASRPFRLLVRFQSVIGLIVVAIGGVIFSPRRHGVILFLQPDNIANIVRAVSETGIIAVGMTFVIITAGIDLSVGALLSLSSVLTATIMTTGGLGPYSDDPLRAVPAARPSAQRRA